MIYYQARSCTRRLPREGFTWGSNRNLNTMEPAYFPNACIIEPSVQLLL